MKEKLNLCELLKGHEGKNFYSLIEGNVTLYRIREFDNVSPIDVGSYFYTREGKINPNGECVLFPSKDQRDWRKWGEEQKSKTPKTWSEAVNVGKAKQYVANTHVTHNYDELTPIEKSALALLKIHQLIEVGYGGVVTNAKEAQDIIYWDYKANKPKFDTYTEVFNNGSIIRLKWGQAKEFLLYPENVQLLKDFYMV